MCGLVSISFFFVVMAVADGIAQLLTLSNLLLKPTFAEHVYQSMLSVFENRCTATLSLGTWFPRKKWPREIRHRTHWLSFVCTMSVIITNMITNYLNIVTNYLYIVTKHVFWRSVPTAYLCQKHQISNCVHQISHYVYIITNHEPFVLLSTAYMRPKYIITNMC